ncbi:MAG: von Willebrand factor type A domain-containing protein [Opitutaceae bacterium]|jgi:hypothetical protein
MNNDDTFKNTNNNNDRTSAGLTPELEVRVVAWVLGEATSAEAAELVRLAGENLALADFKRRIETVHGLVGASARTVADATLRLSDQRRAKVLAVIGEDADEAGEQRTEVVMRTSPRWVQAWNKWALPMAACITLCVLLGAVMIPMLGTKSVVVGKKKAFFAEAPVRPEPSSTLLGASFALGPSIKGQEVVDASVSLPDMPMVMFASGSAGGGRGLDAKAPGPAAAMPPPPPAPTDQPDSRSAREGSVTLGGANTYTGGSFAVSGNLSLERSETIPAEVRRRREFRGQKQLMPLADGTEAAASSAPASGPAAASAEDMAMDRFAPSSPVATEAAKPQAKLDTGGLNEAAGKDQSSASGGFASSDKVPVLGDVPLIGRAFDGESMKRVTITTGTPQSFAEVDDSYPVHEAKPKEQGQEEGVTITAGTVQEFKLRNLTAAENQALRNNATSPAQAADYFAAPVSTQAPLSDEAKKSAEKDQRHLLAKGRSQYLAGDLDGAQESFRVAESRSPDDRQASLFLERIAKEKSAVAQLNRAKTRSQMVEEVSSSWQRPSAYVDAKRSDSMVFSAPAKTSDPAELMREGLNRIRIPQLSFKDVPLSKVLSTLTSASEEYNKTEGAKPLDFVFEGMEANDPAVTITLRNLTVKKILDFITESVGYHYEVRGNTVVVRPGAKGPTLVTEFIPVSREVIAKMRGSNETSGNEPAGNSGEESGSLRRFLQQSGVNFQNTPGSSLAYDGAALLITDTEQNRGRLRELIRRYEAEVAKESLDHDLRAETATNQQAVSTFSLHVSDASFRIAKAALARGEAPDPAAIRPEEFYNAFDYGDPSAMAGEPVACRIEQSAHPFLQQRNLVRIAMKVPATGRGAGQPLRLTVLLDTSGSMEREDRAAGVRAALTSLVSLLGADDRLTLIGFARQPHLLADRVPGNQAAGLADLVAKTPFEGGTNLEEALKLAGNLARGQFTASAQNRIVLLTDGAANLGNDDPAQLAAMIAALRQQGIAFDACGVGADGLDDTILEALTRKGDGRYTVINSPEEADSGFAKKLAGAFRPAAENVKVQVRFNPSRVAHYRLIGFEKHRLKTEDFRNDRVDAAELAAEEAAVALYQVEVLPGGEGELGEVFVRFRDAATGNMVEHSWTLAYVPQPPAFARSTPSMKLAGTAAFLAEKLRGGDLASQIRLEEFAPVVNTLRSDYAHDARVKDLVTMFAQARRLTGE